LIEDNTAIIEWYVDRHFKQKKAFPTQKILNKNPAKKGKIINPFADLNKTPQKQTTNKDLENEKAKAHLYCESLYMFWKTSIAFHELDYQFIHDTCLLIKIWERTKTQLHYEFWSAAFGGKKGK